MSSVPLVRLLRPRSIAVVGASPEKTSIGGLLLANLQRFGYDGELHLVSRSRESVNGQRCFKSIDELPEGVDAAVLMVPQVAVCDAVEACGRRGIGGAVVFASGFAELGEAGQAEQRRLTAIAQRYGVALLGPNCLGFINFFGKIPLTFEPVQPPEYTSGPRVAIIAQSGAMSGNLRQAFVGKGLGVAFSVSTGNEAVLSTEDVLAELVEADDIDAFAVFVEMVRRPAEFLRVARRARELCKPIVLMHPGRSLRAREVAKSHTGAFAGDYQVMRALVEREGVVVVETMDELFDVTAILARYPTPVAEGKAVVSSNSGALRGVSIDLCEAVGLELATFQPETMAALARVLPDFITPDNPLDVTAMGMLHPEIFGQSSEAILADPGVGSLIVSVMGGSPAQQVLKGKSALPVLASSVKPVCFVMLGDAGPLGSEFMDLAMASKVPFLRSPDRAIRAMAHVHRYARLCAAAAQREVPAAGRLGAVQEEDLVEHEKGKLPGALGIGTPVGELRTVDGALGVIRVGTVDEVSGVMQAGPVAEYKGKRLLNTLGISTPAGGLACTVDEALRIAARIGYPVVIKAQADQLTHKSDVGGVAVGLPDAAALRLAWHSMKEQLAARCPELTLDGILVEAMAPSGLEMVIGGRRDPNWGVVMMAGLGGVWIEALRDVRLFAPDMTQAQVVAELSKLKGARLLSGLRGSAPVDVAAVAQALRQLAGLMLANPQISEVDVNPLIALPEGEGVMALDALFVMA